MPNPIQIKLRTLFGPDHNRWIFPDDLLEGFLHRRTTPFPADGEVPLLVLPINPLAQIRRSGVSQK
jgi:hypothetical protein